MDLIKILNEMAKGLNKDGTPKRQNFVAKYMQNSGAGTHAAKKGKLAPRARQKKEWKKEQMD